MLNTILGVLFTILTGTIAFAIFILSEHKDEIWEHIEFKEEE